MTDDAIVGDGHLVLATRRTLWIDRVRTGRQLDPGHPHDVHVDHEPQDEVEVALEYRVSFHQVCKFREFVRILQRHLDERRFLVEPKQITTLNHFATLDEHTIFTETFGEKPLETRQIVVFFTEPGGHGKVRVREESVDMANHAVPPFRDAVHLYDGSLVMIHPPLDRRLLE